MATIALVLDHQEGHLIPTFPLARRLVERGHRVVYLTVADGGELIRKNGFELEPILEDLYPKGRLATLREGGGLASFVAEADPTEKMRAAQLQYAASVAGGPEWDPLVARIRPDLFLALSLYPASALLLELRFGRPVLLLTPFLREEPKELFALQVEEVFLKMTRGAPALFELVMRARPQARRLADVLREVVAFPELILAPAALEIPRPDRAAEPEVHYIEAPVDASRLIERDAGFPWQRIDPGKKLLLGSMGSQSYLVGRDVLRTFYRRVAEVARREPAWQLVLASGGQVEAADLPDLPADAVVVPWVPQLALLQRAAAFLTHGGLGALREAIAHLVPMAVFPFIADQPANARRLVHHGLGLAGSLAETTADELHAMIRQLDGDPAFRQNLERMRERFREAEKAELGVQIIERAIGERRADSAEIRRGVA